MSFANQPHFPAERGYHRMKRIPQPFGKRADGDQEFTLTGPVTLTLTFPAAGTSSASTVVATSSRVPSTQTAVTDTDTTSSSSSSASSRPPSTTVSTPATTSATSSTQPSASASVISSPSPSASSTPAQSGAISGGSSGLSGGATAGIVIVCLVLGVGVLFFVRFLVLRRRRSRKSPEWVNNVTPYSFSEKAETTRFMAAQDPPTPTPFIAPFAQHNERRSSSNFTMPKAPGSTYGNAPAQSTGPVENATVRSTFVPSLPDELSIVTGENVKIMQEFDDGWALCKNSAGEQGMVPLECLDRAYADTVRR